MAKFVKDVMNNTDRTEITCSDDKVEKESQTAVTTSSITVKEEFVIAFAPGRHLVCTFFNDQVLVSMLERNAPADQQEMMLRGVCFTPSQLMTFRNRTKEIDELLKHRNLNKVRKVYKVGQGDIVFRAHIAAGLYVSVDRKFSEIDIRRYEVPEGWVSVAPTKEGICIPVSQWNLFKLNIDKLLTSHPELFAAKECFHNNSLDVIDCRECLPFGLQCL